MLLCNLFWLSVTVSHTQLLLSHFIRSHDSVVPTGRFRQGLWPGMFVIAQARGWCLGSAGAVGLLLEVSGLTLHGTPTTGWADFFLDGSGFPSRRAEAADVQA